MHLPYRRLISRFCSLIWVFVSFDSMADINNIQGWLLLQTRAFLPLKRRSPLLKRERLKLWLVPLTTPEDTRPISQSAAPLLVANLSTVLA